MTAPSEARRSLVRTNAPPLPGFTCWNSRILKIVPSTSTCVPLRNWFVVITTHEGSGVASSDHRQLLRERGQDLAALVGHHHKVLDPHAKATGQVHPRL